MPQASTTPESERDGHVRRLVLLPGVDGSDVFFRPLIAQRPAGVEVRSIAYDAIDAASYEALAERVIERLPRDDFFLLGWSFSGPLALMLAARGVPGLRGVILAASFATRPLRLLPSWTQALAQPWLLSLYPLASMTQARLRGYSSAELRALQREAFSRTTSRALAARVRMVLGVDATEPLRACPVPLLYLRALEDRTIHTGHADMIAAHAPQARIVDLPGSHLSLTTHPEQAWSAILPFLMGTGLGA
jgi:pimeloyl-[acyl-carrier protein] methyl ester esterase